MEILTELFVESVKHYADFGDRSIDDLYNIATHISSNFKGIYQSYSKRESSFSDGITEVKFNLENDEVTVVTSSVEIKFTEKLFLKYLNLMDLCFFKMLPIGSVIKLDTEMMPEDFRKSFSGSHASMFTISGRKTFIQGKFGEYYVDYVARLFPFGESQLAQPFLISNMMIREVIFEGFSNELEKQFVDNVLRQDLINKKRRNISYLLDSEVKALENAIQSMTNPEGGTS